jgi:two-component system chemotaxis response regulator CheY
MCPDVRILVVSALSDKPTALKALKNGASDFLYKPFNDRQLIDAIEELVS